MIHMVCDCLIPRPVKYWSGNETGSVSFVVFLCFFRGALIKPWIFTEIKEQRYSLPHKHACTHTCMCTLASFPGPSDRKLGGAWEQGYIHIQAHL